VRAARAPPRCTIRFDQIDARQTSNVKVGLMVGTLLAMTPLSSHPDVPLRPNFRRFLIFL
jgi:hypothetical protein